MAAEACGPVRVPVLPLALRFESTASIICPLARADDVVELEAKGRAVICRYSPAFQKRSDTHKSLLITDRSLFFNRSFRGSSPLADLVSDPEDLLMLGTVGVVVDMGG